MIIITADDYGKTKHATDNILQCFSNKRITSLSAMPYMEDSERAADMSLIPSLEVGLHLNFTLPFNAYNVPSKLREHQNKLVSYLNSHRFSQVIFNPFLHESFKFVFLSQQEEFARLYGKLPEYYNGHHHMHLCTNVLVGNVLPKGARVRRTYTFDSHEKNFANRFYRLILAFFVSRRFVTTDNYFSIVRIYNREIEYERLRNIVKRAVKETIEIGVHPENDKELRFLLSDKFQNLIDSAQVARFSNLKKNKPKKHIK